MYMKTAISIDPIVFEVAEGAAAKMGLSRSRLYTLAIQEYLQNHQGDSVTERLNQYYGEYGAETDEGVKQAARALFAKEDW
jgi:hypothetical protein